MVGEPFAERFGGEVVGCAGAPRLELSADPINVAGGVGDAEEELGELRGAVVETCLLGKKYFRLKLEEICTLQYVLC